MKTAQIALVSLTLLTAGCVLVPSPYSEQLKPATRLYASIKSGGNRAEIAALLGKPNREEEGGPTCWETRVDELNYVLVKVWFDGGNTAKKVEFIQAHGTSLPGYHASAVSTRAK